MRPSIEDVEKQACEVKDLPVPGTLEDLAGAKKMVDLVFKAVREMDDLHEQALKEHWTVGQFSAIAKKKIAASPDRMETLEALAWFENVLKSVSGIYVVGTLTASLQAAQDMKAVKTE